MLVCVLRFLLWGIYDPEQGNTVTMSSIINFMFF